MAKRRIEKRGSKDPELNFAEAIEYVLSCPMCSNTNTFIGSKAFGATGPAALIVFECYDCKYLKSGDRINEIFAELTARKRAYDALLVRDRRTEKALDD